MSRHLQLRLTRLGGALLLAATGALAQSAELGEAVVRSYAGQPLVADVEITGIVDDAIAVQVRPASADVYRGANVGIHPVIANVFMSVMRRDGRQFLHVTSVKPAEGDHVLLFLELNDGGRRTVRSVTLWLAPDPAPAPVPVPPPAQVDMVATPAAEVPAARAAAAAATAAHAHASAPVAFAPIALAPALRARTGGAGMCTSQFSAEQIKTCSELDYKNGVLSAQIVELEEKVKALQLAMDARPVAAPAAIKPAAAAPTHAAPAVKPKPKSTPWLLIGGAVAALLALAGGGAFYVMRRKGKGKKNGKDKTSAGPAAESAAAPVKAGVMARLKALFGRKKKAPAAGAVDPAAHG